MTKQVANLLQQKFENDINLTDFKNLSGLG
jgi:hypothetical protein